MKRREFLSGNLKKRNDVSFLGAEPEINGTLEKETRPLDQQMAYHLLRRFSFGPSYSMVKEFIGLSVDEAADKILGTGSEQSPDASSLAWLNKQEEDPLGISNDEIRGQIMRNLRENYNHFSSWWLKQMAEGENYSMEKLTLFWSTVWCIEFAYDTLSLIPPPLLYRNNELLRKYRMGNYKDLALDMTLDGAMLLYQSLYYSSINAPNENYARELLELFTMGIGHYSEGDIQASSALLTGWRTAAYKYEKAPNGIFNTYFEPNAHLYEGAPSYGRTFMGNTIPPIDLAENTEYQVKEKEVKAIINIMFTERALPIGKFIADKIYRYFVYASQGDVDSNIINDLAEIMVNNDFELRPVLKTLITSKHFYDAGAIGIQFKTPPEFIAGFQRQLNVEYENAREACDALEQILYNPPNVGSWKGYRTWLSTTTLPLRIKYANEILDEASDSDLINIVKQFPVYTDIISACTHLLEYFLAKIPAEYRVARYMDIMTSKVAESAWSDEITNGSTAAAAAIRELIKEIIKAPDFQLC